MSHRRGALLLEVMLSVALFVGAASFCLVVTRSLFSAMDRADRRQLCVDLACSKMAELEAGLTTLQDLRGEWSGAIGSRSVDDELALDRAQWQFDVQTSRTEFQGLSLVELTVSELSETAGATRAGERVSFTLRQLVALRELDAEAYEVDDLLEGLPEAQP